MSESGRENIRWYCLGLLTGTATMVVAALIEVFAS